LSPRVFALCGLLLSAGSASAVERTFWLSPAPEDPAESALREALETSAFGGPESTAVRLARVAEPRSGSLTAGLARLAAGLAFVEANRPELALEQLRQADVARTALGDRVQLAIGQALEAQRDAPGAAAAYLAAAELGPGGAVECVALFRAAENLERSSLLPRAIETLTRALSVCPGQEARALLDVARLQELRKDLPAAAAAYDRLDREYPASAQARTTVHRLAALRSLLPAEKDEARLTRELKKALALCEAGLPSDAAPLLRALKTKPLAPADLDLVRVRLGRSALALTRTREATAELAAVAPTSAYAAEAAFYRAKLEALRTRSMQAYEAVANGFPGTPWAEEALLALANNYQKDARDEEALPYYRRLLEAFPEGRFADRAGWRVGWGEYRAGRFAEAAQTLERTARLRHTTPFSAGLVYWAGRARLEAGDTERARQLLEETVRRYKNSYHGQRAQAILAGFARRPADKTPLLVARAPDPQREIPEPAFTRIRQLLLIDQLGAAQEELSTLPASALSQATIAWIENRQGRLRPAITAMKRAYPEHISEAGDLLPPEVWRILYPLEFGDLLRAKAAEEGVDPALVAAIICQESTFNAGAVSSAGARGLMQVIPPTGRSLARSLGVRYKTAGLHDPATSLGYGTRYLRQLFDRFGGRVERVLAAYNAGPYRVDAWTSGRPEMGDEEFVESIPFTETRQYVMIILANREHYRRIYDLGAAPQRATDAGSWR
jgi:soluble lytic murein transglycosylase